jgi:cholesterol 7-desaturase
VIGECIECPFHGWQYNGQDGRCTSIPYAESAKIPANANNLAWPTHEYANMVCVFFDQNYDQNMREQPDYPPYLPPAAACQEAGWVLRGRWKARTTMHIQVLPCHMTD